MVGPRNAPNLCGMARIAGELGLVPPSVSERRPPHRRPAHGRTSTPVPFPAGPAVGVQRSQSFTKEQAEQGSDPVGKGVCVSPSGRLSASCVGFAKICVAAATSGKRGQWPDLPASILGIGSPGLLLCTLAAVHPPGSIRPAADPALAFQTVFFPTWCWVIVD